MATPTNVLCYASHFPALSQFQQHGHGPLSPSHLPRFTPVDHSLTDAFEPFAIDDAAGDAATAPPPSEPPTTATASGHSHPHPRDGPHPSGEGMSGPRPSSTHWSSSTAPMTYNVVGDRGSTAVGRRRTASRETSRPGTRDALGATTTSVGLGATTSSLASADEHDRRARDRDSGSRPSLPQHGDRAVASRPQTVHAVKRAGDGSVDMSPPLVRHSRTSGVNDSTRSPGVGSPYQTPSLSTTGVSLGGGGGGGASSPVVDVDTAVVAARAEEALNRILSSTNDTLWRATSFSRWETAGGGDDGPLFGADSPGKSSSSAAQAVRLGRSSLGRASTPVAPSDGAADLDGSFTNDDDGGGGGDGGAVPSRRPSSVASLSCAPSPIRDVVVRRPKPARLTSLPRSGMAAAVAPSGAPGSSDGGSKRVGPEAAAALRVLRTGGGGAVGGGQWQTDGGGGGSNQAGGHVVDNWKPAAPQAAYRSSGHSRVTL